MNSFLLGIICSVNILELGSTAFTDMKCFTEQIKDCSMDKNTSYHEPCADDEFCNLLLANSGPSKWLCCARNTKVCYETELHNYRSYSRNASDMNDVVVVQRKMNNPEWIPEDEKQHDEKYPNGLYYNDGHSVEIECLKPLSYQLVNIDKKKALAVGFEKGKKQKTCIKSSDCEYDEFCGHTFNPTYCGTENNRHPYFNNSCIDKSDNGKSFMFCYKLPYLPNGFITNRDSVGLTLCKDDSMCATIPHSVCHKMDVSNYRYISPNGTGLDLIYGEQDHYLFEKNGYVSLKNVPHGMTGMCLVEGWRARVCPSNKKPTRGCKRHSREQLCADDEFCYWNNDKIIGDAYFCCSKNDTFCEETGMHSLNSNEGNDIFVHPNHRVFRPHEVYKVRTRQWDKGVWCPKPFSYQLGHLGIDRSLAVGFEIGKKQKTCVKSSDCNDDEFCGHTYNPTYCIGTYNAHHYFDNNCLDKSDNGKSFMFCYKLPDLPDGFKISRDSVGLPLCNSVSMCATMPNSECLRAGGLMYRYVDPNREFPDVVHPDTFFTQRIARHGLVGMCLEAHNCDIHRHTSTLGLRPKTDIMCVAGRENRCPLEGSECVKSSMPDEDFCCQLRPPPTTKTTSTTMTTTPTTKTTTPNIINATATTSSNQTTN